MGRLFLISFILRLFREPRVPALLKGLVLLTLLYSLFPKTWLPFGPLDNLLLPLLGLAMLFLFSPWSVLREHWRRRAEGSRTPSDKQVVDVNYRVLEDDQE